MSDQEFETVEDWEQMTGGEALPPSESQKQEPSFATVEEWEKSESTRELKSSVYQATPKAPDRQAEILRLSEATKLPPELVERNFDELSVKHKRDSFDADSMIERFPRSSEFLKDPNNAALAQDDLDNVKKTENAVKKHYTFSEFILAMTKVEQEASGEQTTLGWISDAYSVGRAKFIDSVLKTPALVSGAYESAKQMVTGETAERPPDWLLNNELTKVSKGLGEQYQSRVPELDKSITEEIGNGNIGEASRALAAQFLSNAHQQVVTLGTGMAGLKVVAAGMAGVTTASSAFDEAMSQEPQPATGGGELGMTMAPPSVPQATANALIHGTIEATMERFGSLGILDKWQKDLTKTYSKQVAKEVMKEFGKTTLSAMGTEASEEMLTSLAQDFSSYVTGVDKNAMKGSVQRALDAAIVGGFSGGVMGGAYSISKAQARGQYLKQAEEAKTLYTELGKTAEESKIRERLPQKHKELIEKITKDGPVENVFIPVDEFKSYFQGKKQSPEAFAQQLGVSKQYDEAVQTGTDIQVPLADWVEKVVGTEHYEHFANHSKFNPDDLTFNQAQAERKKTAEALKTEDEAAMAARPKTTREVIKEYAEQLKAAGQDPKQAALLAGIGGLASKEGINPVDFYNELNLSIVRGKDALEQGNVLNQLPPEVVKRLNMPTELPQSEEFNQAVAGTPAAKVTPDGLEIDLVRFQKPEQMGADSVRTGVFYLPKGAKQTRYYRGSNTNYGGTEKVEGPTLLKKPLFVKGATGGKAPEMAFVSLKGKEAFKELESKVLAAVNANALRKDTALFVENVSNLLSEYGADPALASEIVRNSKQGNQLRYALQENIIAHVVREAGYDSVLGYSKGKNGPFLSEVFDVREVTYPTPEGDFTLHRDFEKILNQSSTFLENNASKLVSEGYDIWVSPDPAFDENGDEIEGPKVGEAGYSFSVYTQKENKDVAFARFKIDENGSLIPDDDAGGGYAVKVEEEHRRKGIATEMYRQAAEHVGKPISNVNALTPEGKKLREALKEADPEMFMQGGDVPRGQIRFGTRLTEIRFLEGADPSTFIHETGHLYLETLKNLSLRENVSEQTKKDMQTILDWFGITSASEIKTEHHEKFADGFMTYVAEGSAPSNDLKGVFKRFKFWVLSVANKLILNKVDLSPEVRDVMARMLQSEAEIEAAQDRADFGPLLGPAAMVGMSEKESMEYVKATQQARDFAVEEINKKLMDDLKKKQRAEYKAAKEKFVEEIKGQVQNSIVYRAISIISKGELPDGTKVPDSVGDLRLDRQAFTQEEAEGLPRGILVKGGMSPEVVAPILGFESSTAMMEAIASAPPQKDFIEQEASRRMEKEFPSLVNDPSLPEQATAALHNEHRAKMLEMELTWLANNAPKVLKNAIRKTVRRVPPIAEVRADAEAIIAAKQVQHIKPNIYQRAEIQSAKEAGEALAKGDIDKAFEAKRRELLNHELYRAATEAKENIKKTIERFQDIATKEDKEIAKSRDTDIVNAAKAVISQFWINPIVEGTPDDYLGQLKKYDLDTYNVVNDLVQSAFVYSGDINTLSYDEIMDLSKSVEALWSLSKTIKQIDVDGKKMDKEQIISELESKIAEYNDPKVKAGKRKRISDAEKRMMRFIGGRAGLIRAEHWADTMDVENNGPFRRYIINPIMEGTTNYRAAKNQTIEKFTKLIQDHAKNLTKTKIDATELGYEFDDKAHLLGAMLHTGNESNLSKLLRGREWGDVNDDGTLNTKQWDAFVSRMQQEGVLTKADYDFLQSVWDLMEELKPNAQKAHKKMYGYYFNEITSQEIVTPFGTYKGGYVPARVDMDESKDAKIREDRELFEKNNNSFQFPTTGRGFTKSRVDQYVAPLVMDLSLVSGHVDAVLRFTHIEPRVKDVARITNDAGFRQTMATHVDSEILSEMITPWLQRAAQQRTTTPSTDGTGKLIGGHARTLKTNIAMQFMVGNVTNALQQVTGLFVAAVKVKPKYLRNALVTYISGAKQMGETMLELSPFMKTTQGSNIYEMQQAIDDIILDPTVFDNMKAFAKKHTYFLQTLTQNFVNTVTWTAAYEQAIEQKLSPEQAVKDADRAVRLTQGTNNPEDIARYQAGTATQQLFTQFTGYFNMVANLNAGELIKVTKTTGLRKGAGRAFYIYTMGFMLPAVASDLIVRMMAGDGLDADDDDDYLDDMLASFFGSQFSTVNAMLPYYGSVISLSVKQFNGKVYDDRLSFSPVISTIESLTRVPADVYKAIAEGTVNKKKVTKDALMLLGICSSLPLGPVGRPAGYLIDVAEGEADPTGPIDFTRGLISGKKGNN